MRAPIRPLLACVLALSGCPNRDPAVEEPPDDPGDPGDPVPPSICDPGAVTRASDLAPDLHAWILAAEQGRCHLERRTSGGAIDGFTDEVHAALMDALLGAGSDLAILPVQDILGTREQVNVPGTVTDENWTYRLPFRLEAADHDPARRARLDRARRLAEAHGRCP